MQKYYQNKPRFNGVYSRDNLPDKIKEWAYVINLDEYSGITTHWIALYTLNDNASYFDSFMFNQFQIKTKDLSMDLLLQQKFIEYKHIIQ